MVSERTEEEQIEAFKNWWAENGLKTILGIFLIFGGYVGWQSYESKVASESQAASDIWQTIITTMNEAPDGNLSQENIVSIHKNGDKLKNEYGSTSYAHFAAAMKAKLAVEANNIELAVQELTWVLDNGADNAFVPIITLRLAKLEASRKNYEEALKILENADPGTLKSSFEETKGDLYMVLERTDEAYTAYNSAILFNKTSDQLLNNVLQLKLSQVNPANIDLTDVSDEKQSESNNQIDE